MNDLHFQTNREENGLVWFSAPRLNADGGAVRGFSSRLGGVSRGYLTSLNLGTSRGDQMEHVREELAGCEREAVGFDSTKTVFSQQVHRDDVRVVTEADCGKGLYRERDYDSADGLVTNCPGIPLAIFSADCIPVLFHDPVNRVVAACQPSWRGHCRELVGKMVRKVTQQFGCRTETSTRPSAPASPAAASRPTTTCPTPCGRFWASRPTPLSTGCPGRSF